MTAVRQSQLWQFSRSPAPWQAATCPFPEPPVRAGVLSVLHGSRAVFWPRGLAATGPWPSTEATSGGDSRGHHLFYSPFTRVFLSFPSGIQTRRTRMFKTNCSYGGD